MKGIGPFVKRDLAVVLRSKGPWALPVIIVLWSYVISYTDAGGLEVVHRELGSATSIAIAQLSFSPIISLSSLLLTYRSVNGEIKDGRMRLTAAMPIDRTELVMGKILSRTVAVSLLVVLGFSAVIIVEAVRHGYTPIVRSGVAIAILICYVGTVTTLGVTTSALVSEPRRSAAALLSGYYLIFEVFWREGIALWIYSVTNGTQVNRLSPPESGALFLHHRFTPSGAAHTLTNWVIGVPNSDGSAINAIRHAQPDATLNYVLVVDLTFGDSAPWYLHESFGFVILVTWIVIPLVICLAVFKRGDLA